jgi:hypothetical protein
MSRISTDPQLGDEPVGSDRSAAGGVAGRHANQVIDARATLGRVRRLSRLDATVFSEVRDDPTQSLGAVLVAVAAIVLSAVGGWLWLISDVDGLSTGRIVLREFFLGSLIAFALWSVWIVAAQTMLSTVFRRPTSRGALFRTMGYATLPAAAALFMVVPAVSFAIGLISIVAWFAASNAAIESAAPNASRREVLVANTAGFAVFATLSAVFADAAGLAPGFFARGADLAVFV